MKTKAQNLIQQINNSNIYTPHCIDYEIDFTDVTKITTIDLDEHRWYVVGTIVYKIDNEFFGVRGPISLKSEEMDYCDVGMICEAFEMQEVPTVTYIKKKPKGK